MTIEKWSKIALETFRENLSGVFKFVIFNLFGAIFVFLIGWIIAKLVGKIVTQVLIRLKVNQFFESTGWQEALEKAEIKVNLAEFIGEICKWILIIIALTASIEVLGFYQFADLLNRFVSWLPNLLVAIAIFVVAIVVAEILEKVLKASIKKMGVNYVGVIGGITRWGIYIFALLLILNQLGVGREIINAIVYGIVGTLTLALGLSFGLGGKEIAQEIIKEIKKKIFEK